MTDKDSIMKWLQWILRNSTYGNFVPDFPCYKAGEALKHDVAESFTVSKASERQNTVALGYCFSDGSQISEEAMNEIERLDKDV